MYFFGIFLEDITCRDTSPLSEFQEQIMAKLADFSPPDFFGRIFRVQFSCSSSSMNLN